MDKDVMERVGILEQQQKTNSENIDKINTKLDEDEKLIQSLNTTLAITVEKISHIAEDLKKTSENLKDVVQASSNANIKEFENMRNRLSDIEKDIENVKTELKKETTDKELNQFRDIKSIILKWGLTIALGAIAVYFGIKQQ